MINYQKILDQNMINVFRDVLIEIRDNGLSSNNHIYITFITNHKKVELPKWIKEKYPEEMTIIIQYEYYDLKVNKNNFSITLSFNDIKANLKIGFDSIISFADPSSNFGLILKNNRIPKKISKNLNKNKIKRNNILNFSDYRKD